MSEMVERVKAALMAVDPDIYGDYGELAHAAIAEIQTLLGVAINGMPDCTVTAKEACLALMYRAFPEEEGEP